MGKIGLALAQTCIVWEDKAANYKKAEYMLRQAKAHHADTIFFPEMSFTGFSMNISATAKDMINLKKADFASALKLFILSRIRKWVNFNIIR